MLDIIMTSYNQGTYISDAIESVLMQECDFEFNLLIFDDASVDNTVEICNLYIDRYPDRIKLFTNDVNVGLIRNYINAFNNCTANYIAILEADDYWLDKRKLSKQIQFLEKNNDYGLIHARPKVILNNSFKIDYNVKKNKHQGAKLFEEIVLGKYSISPLTVVFRRKLLENVDLNVCVSNEYQTIDLFLWLEFVMKTKIHFQGEVVGVYRYLDSSVSNTFNFDKRDNFIKSSIRIVDFHIKRHSISPKIVRKIHTKQYSSLLKNAFLFQNHNKINEYSAKVYCLNIESCVLLFYSLSSRFHRFYLWQESFMNYMSNFKQKILSAIKIKWY